MRCVFSVNLRLVVFSVLFLSYIAAASFTLDQVQAGHGSEVFIAQDRLLETAKAQITAAPSFHKRDGATICSGYSIVGNTDPYASLWCGSGFTCVFGGYGGASSYYTCGIPGDSYTWITGCFDYSTTCVCAASVKACSCSSALYCPSSAPFCESWVITDTKTFYQWQCATAPGEVVNIVRVHASTTSSDFISTSSTHVTPLETSTTSSSSTSNAQSAPETTSMTSISSSLASESISTSTSTLSSTETSVSPTNTSASTQNTESSSSSKPTGINLAAVIAGTLGGVGSFAAGLLAVYEFIKRRNKKRRDEGSAETS